MFFKTHHGEQVPEDEELTPTLENFIVLTWLRLIHPSLPRLVKQRYGTELRSRSRSRQKSHKLLILFLRKYAPQMTLGSCVPQ